MADTQPLSVPRESLISRLQERKQEVEDARKKAQDARTASRQALLDAVSKLTADQVANILFHYAGSNGFKTQQDWIEDIVERKAFVTEDEKVTAVETTLEKLIRVLELATNKEIEVYPTDPLYSYI